ncbi:winged helix-turn-helix domain-containing protein [Candidatus Kaiserbacteria bacterium]|nr:MAG: winged helix-turn-helix domain-containing protein [Candidatus Kaiserbacteria bacterium]
MNILLLIVAGAVGVALGVYFGKGNDVPTVSFGNRKRKRLDKILTLYIDNDEITNSDVRELLNVSDATATRYLDQLEDEGKIEQIGETGMNVFYRSTKAQNL